MSKERNKLILNLTKGGKKECRLNVSVNFSNMNTNLVTKTSVPSPTTCAHNSVLSDFPGTNSSTDEAGMDVDYTNFN